MNARKAGVTHEGLPVFGTVKEAMEQTGADVSVVFVPPAHTKAAVREAIDAEIPLCVVITEGVPVHDTTEFWAYAVSKGNKTRIIGPNCPGIASPGASNAGIIPADITTKGRVGLVSKSGTLTYQLMYELRDIGFSTCVGIGGDPVIGTTHIDALQAFQDDPETDAIVMIGEIGGDAEERAAAYINEHVTKPVVAYVAGFTAPEGKTMGHAGAIVSGSAGDRPGQEGGPGEGRRPRRPYAQRDRPPDARDHVQPLISYIRLSSATLCSHRRGGVSARSRSFPGPGRCACRCVRIAYSPAWRRGATPPGWDDAVT